MEGKRTVFVGTVIIVIINNKTFFEGKNSN